VAQSYYAVDLIVRIHLLLRREIGWTLVAAGRDPLGVPVATDCYRYLTTRGMVDAIGGYSVGVIAQKEPGGVQGIVLLPMLALVVLSHQTDRLEDSSGNSHPLRARCDP
jgi:hypothetical protein